MHSFKELIFIGHSVKEQFLHSVKEHIFKEQVLILHSVREQIFIRHSVKEQIFAHKTQCQGAYAGDDYIEFKDRIGKKTELKTMQFAGELDEEEL